MDLAAAGAAETLVWLSLVSGPLAACEASPAGPGTFSLLANLGDS